MHCEEVRAIRRLTDTLLAKHRVKETLLILRIVIKLFNQQRIGVNAVDPL